MRARAGVRGVTRRATTVQSEILSWFKSPKRKGVALVNMDLLSRERVAKGFIGVAADLDDPWLFKVLRPSLQDG